MAQVQFFGKTAEQAARKFSNDWDYAFPLLLKPNDARKPLTQERIQEIQKERESSQKARIRCELLPDGKILSLDRHTSNVLFDNGYTVEYNWINH